MPTFNSDTRGGIDDRVRLILADKEVVVAESYHVKASVFEQPESFSLTLGWGRVAAELMKKYPPKTPFQLHIGNVLTQTGETDGYEASTEPATELTIEGRDMIARLYDDHVEAETSFKGDTYSSLVRKMMSAVGLDPTTLLTTATADRMVRANTNELDELEPSPAVDEVQQDAAGHPVTGIVEQEIKNKIGERRLMFLRRYLDRAGLFLRCAADGKLILSAPNVKQLPIARIVRGRDDKFAPSNVLGAKFRNNTRSRFSEVSIYGRGGGRGKGRVKIHTAVTDDEMLNNLAAGGIGYDVYQRRLVVREANVQTIAQATRLAKRRIGEGRRDGWVLTYRLSGHTTPTIDGSSRMVWTPDIMVDVDDAEFGIKEQLYVESCEYSRGPQTQTVIRLMRPLDVTFAVAA